MVPDEYVLMTVGLVLALIALAGLVKGAYTRGAARHYAPPALPAPSIEAVFRLAGAEFQAHGLLSIFRDTPYFVLLVLALGLMLVGCLGLPEILRPIPPACDPIRWPLPPGYVVLTGATETDGSVFVSPRPPDCADADATAEYDVASLGTSLTGTLNVRYPWPLRSPPVVFAPAPGPVRLRMGRSSVRIPSAGGTLAHGLPWTSEPVRLASEDGSWSGTLRCELVLEPDARLVLFPFGIAPDSAAADVNVSAHFSSAGAATWTGTGPTAMLCGPERHPETLRLRGEAPR